MIGVVGEDVSARLAAIISANSPQRVQWSLLNLKDRKIEERWLDGRKNKSFLPIDLPIE